MHSGTEHLAPMASSTPTPKLWAPAQRDNVLYMFITSVLLLILVM